MKPFQTALLEKLKGVQKKLTGNNMPIDEKNELLTACAEFQKGFKGPIAFNFKELIEQVFALFNYNLDEIIIFLQHSIDNPFDIRTLQEDTENGFDLRYGTETNILFEQIELPEVISLERLKFSARFHPTPIRIFQRALKTLNKYIGDYSQWGFIDIGTGLGRNVLLASEFPFKQIKGIEISPFLSGKAQENIEKYNLVASKACIAEIHCKDVLDFDFPQQDTVLYFWEPFKESCIMEKLISHLEDRSKIYNNQFILIFLGRCYLDEMTPCSFRLLGTDYARDNSNGDSFFKISFYSNKHPAIGSF